ncbi:hypothetical protein VTN96DRAFT_9202 [Rasamsonia emersonii]
MVKEEGRAGSAAKVRRGWGRHQRAADDHAGSDEDGAVKCLEAELARCVFVRSRLPAAALVLRAGGHWLLRRPTRAPRAFPMSRRGAFPSGHAIHTPP